MDSIRKTNQLTDRRNRNIRLLLVFFTLLFLFAGLNYRQLYSALAIRNESRRLADVAEEAPEEFQNPAPVEDRFEGRLSPEFWKFTTINGGGEVSNETAWHSASMTFNHGLTIQHFPDPAFKDETSDSHEPAADQYNNVTLIGGGGFQPSPSSDVVLKFTAHVDEQFYGTAGVIFQPVGTLQENGLFAKPFDMFGYSVTGKESSINGITGSLCYLALNWIPVQVSPLQVDPYTLHTYEIRLRWISKTEWLGTVTVDDTVLCRMPMPSFGPVEVQVWSDNYHVIDRPRRWWEIAPSMDLKFQDGGEKQFYLGMIKIIEEAR